MNNQTKEMSHEKELNELIKDISKQYDKALRDLTNR